MSPIKGLMGSQLRDRMPFHLFELEAVDWVVVVVLFEVFDDVGIQPRVNNVGHFDGTAISKRLRRP